MVGDDDGTLRVVVREQPLRRRALVDVRGGRAETHAD
jgi:hypothetical protein